jgi:hypothetical protein
MPLYAPRVCQAKFYKTVLLVNANLATSGSRKTLEIAANMSARLDVVQFGWSGQFSSVYVTNGSATTTSHRRARRITKGTKHNGVRHDLRNIPFSVTGRPGPGSNRVGCNENTIIKAASLRKMNWRLHVHY